MHFWQIIPINSRHIRKYFSKVSDQYLKYFLSFRILCTERTRDRWARSVSLKAIFLKRYFLTLRAQGKEFLSMDLNNAGLYFKLISVASIWTKNIWKVILNNFFLQINFELFLEKRKKCSLCSQFFNFQHFYIIFSLNRRYFKVVPKFFWFTCRRLKERPLLCPQQRPSSSKVLQTTTLLCCGT